MSKAKVCDRCGKVYPVDFDKHSHKMPIKIRHGCDYGKHTDYFEEDLCIECSDEFDNFMNKQYVSPIMITRKNNTDHNEEAY